MDSCWFRCLLALLASFFLLSAAQEQPTTQENPAERDLPLSIDILRDERCEMSLEQTLSLWEKESVPYNNEIFTSCVWSRVHIENHTSRKQVRYLYFPISWWSVECFIDGDPEPRLVGAREDSEFLRVELNPGETRVIYIKYPLPDHAQLPMNNVRQLSEKEHAGIARITSIKFFLLGFLLFPFFFFLAQYFTERDRLNFAYLVFLLGSGLNLLTILDSTPYFIYTPKIIILLFEFRLLHKVFVISVFLCLWGLVKYIHYLLEVKHWKPWIHKAGNWMLWIYFGITLVPFVFPALFTRENYPAYLPYLRVGALLLILYILTVCIWAAIRNLQFSRILLLAFAPFVFGSLYYAISFVFRGNYTTDSHESILLILGFFLTLLLFGLILGFRNKLVKSEKVRLEHKTEQLRELDEFKSRFYTNFTHEFRTPLTVINGIAGQITGHDREKALIRRNSKRLLNTVNQLLELSRLETGKLGVEMVQGDVINFLRYLTESCASLANQKQINLAFFSPHEHLLMDYDAMKLQQILINLISNAIKFTPEYGTVKVVVGEHELRARQFLRITVNDTGVGIAEDHLPHIFDRFYQADSSDTRKGEGSGIGLALVRELVQLLEGSIEVKSELDRGTTVDVFLPIQHNALPASGNVKDMALGWIPEGLDSTEHPDDKGSERPLVLLIEDNADVTEYIVSCLHLEFEVATARNGRAGVEKALDLVPDVIISDVMMPEMDGFEVCSTLKSDRRTSHVPIMLLTAKATREDRVSGFQQGADAYLTKPFDQEELMVRLGNLAAISRRLRENLTSEDETDRESDPLSQQEAEFLSEVDALIHANMDNQEFDTKKLCREIAMSRTQLHRKLKALTGESTASYIRVRRLRKARHLLENTDMPVGEITIQVGYKDFSHFTRSFSQEFGKTPSDIRK